MKDEPQVCVAGGEHDWSRGKRCAKCGQYEQNLPMPGMTNGEGDEDDVE